MWLCRAVWREAAPEPVIHKGRLVCTVDVHVGIHVHVIWGKAPRFSGKRRFERCAWGLARSVFVRRHLHRSTFEQPRLNAARSRSSKRVCDSSCARMRLRKPVPLSRCRAATRKRPASAVDQRLLMLRSANRGYSREGCTSREKVEGGGSEGQAVGGRGSEARRVFVGDRAGVREAQAMCS